MFNAQMKRKEFNMTSTEAKSLKYGDKVTFLDNRFAIVQRVCGNGVWISYDGMGARRGQYVKTRAPARYLTAGWMVKEVAA
jgi:hypothetical protein